MKKMPPKKKTEEKEESHEPVISPFQAEIQASVMATEEGEHIATEIMQEILEKSCDQMVSNYLDRIAVPYTVQLVTKDILDLIQFVFVGRDNGDVEVEDVESWLPDEEPQSVVADSWARGAVPTRRRPLAIQDSEEPADVPAPPLQEKDKKRSAARSPASQRAKEAEDEKNKGKAKPTAPSPPARAQGGQARRRSQRGGFSPERALSQASAVSDEISKELMEQALALRQVAAEQQKRSAIQEEMEETVRNLKQGGKDFTVDAFTGKVIQMKPVDVKRLPQRTMDVRVRIADEEPLVEEAPPEPKKKGYSAPKKGKGKGKRGGGIPPGTFLQPDDQLGPMVEDMKPSGGVTLRQDDSIQRTDLKTLKERPSKAEFKRQLDAMGLTSVNDRDEGRGGGLALPQGGVPVAASPGAGGLGSPPARGEGKKLAASIPMPERISQQPTGQPAKPEAPPETYKPQGVAPVPAYKGDPTAKEHLLGPRAKFPRDRSTIMPSPERKHWTAAAFSAAGSPNVRDSNNSLPGLSSTLIRNDKLAYEFMDSLRPEE